jgi:hypothetical protein
MPVETVNIPSNCLGSFFRLIGGQIEARDLLSDGLTTAEGLWLPGLVPLRAGWAQLVLLMRKRSHSSRRCSVTTAHRRSESHRVVVNLHQVMRFGTSDVMRAVRQLWTQHRCIVPKPLLIPRRLSSSLLIPMCIESILGIPSVANRQTVRQHHLLIKQLFRVELSIHCSVKVNFRWFLLSVVTSPPTAHFLFVTRSISISEAERGVPKK